jgi:hypothetical protein
LSPALAARTFESAAAHGVAGPLADRRLGSSKMLSLPVPPFLPLRQNGEAVVGMMPRLSGIRGTVGPSVSPSMNIWIEFAVNRLALPRGKSFSGLSLKPRQ